ncbi:MAG: sigma-70 family RNA polymerase sigma factor [Thermoleophilia bacterium]|nr:sigma-70 family RNA polymerase sigma factor [Thermoleophilia bacterium]
MAPERRTLLVDRLEHDHIALVLRAMRRRLGNAELAHDATQEVFLRVTRNYASFDPARGSFEGWLLGFVEFTAREYWRREVGRPEPRGELPDGPAESEPLPAISPDLAAAVNALPVRDRALLVLRAIEGWPAVAVGERLGMSTTNVNTAFARVCARLAKRLELPDVA